MYNYEGNDEYQEFLDSMSDEEIEEYYLDSVVDTIISEEEAFPQEDL